MATDSEDKFHAAVAALAVLIGSFGLVLVFSDAPEGLNLRIVTATSFFFLAGAAIGFIHPNGWPMALLTAWGAVLMGVFGTLVGFAKYGGEAFTAGESPDASAGLIMLFGSLGLTLIGGFVGKSLPRPGGPPSR